MSTRGIIVLVVGLAVGSSVLAQQSDAPRTTAPGTAAPDKICRFVVTPEPGTKPYKVCMTAPEWQAKKRADAADVNRIVCRYQQAPGTRITAQKICMPAGEWAEQERLEREAIQHLQMTSCVPGGGC
jgi:hypothetical protein